MRFSDFKLVETKLLAEAKGIFGRNTGDRFVHGDGREYSIVEVTAFPEVGYGADPENPADKAIGKFADAAERDAAIAQFEQEHGAKIEWIGSPASNMLAFGIVTLDDADGGHVYWGKYLQFTKPDMLGTWSNKQVPPGWALATKGAQKLQAGYDPQHLIKTENVFMSADEIIRTVEQNSPDGVRDMFVEALKDLSQGKGDIEFPGMYSQQEAIRDYFGEIMQPLALMGGVIGGQAEDARLALADGANWRDCKVMWPMAMNAALCDSFMIAPNGAKIGISTKGGAGAKASAKNLYDAYTKAEKENNTDLIEANKFTIDIVKIIFENTAKQGPVALGKFLEIPGMDDKLQSEVDGYMNQGKADLEGISETARQILEPYTVKQETTGFNAGYAILSAVAKTVAAEINKRPEFGKGAIALLNQSSIIQVYTKMGKRGDDAVLGEFRAVYPPNFDGTVVMDGGKSYYSSRVGGKMSFGFK